MEVDGLEGVERCTLGIGIIDRLGGLGGCPNAEALLIPEIENVGEKALVSGSCSVGKPSTTLDDTERVPLGAGI